MNESITESDLGAPDGTSGSLSSPRASAASRVVAAPPTAEASRCVATRRTSATVATSSARSCASILEPTLGSARTRQRRHKGFGLGVGETRGAIRLVEARRELGEQLVGRDADRRAEARLGAHRLLDAARNVRGRREQQLRRIHAVQPSGRPARRCSKIHRPHVGARLGKFLRRRRAVRGAVDVRGGLPAALAALARRVGEVDKKLVEAKFCVGPKAQRTAKTDSDASRYGVRSSAGRSSSSGQRCFASSIRINFVTPAARAGIIASDDEGISESAARRTSRVRVLDGAAARTGCRSSRCRGGRSRAPRRHRHLGVGVGGERGERGRPPGRVRARDRAIELKPASGCARRRRRGAPHDPRAAPRAPRLSRNSHSHPPRAAPRSSACSLPAARSARPRLSAARFPR